MLSKVMDVLEKQHYVIVGKHSGVQICRWTKKSLRDEDFCYKEKFYGIKSHLCCQMSPSVMWCQNQCLHCWRAIELNLGKKLKIVDEPKKIISECEKAQRKLLSGFGGNKKVNKKKFKEAQQPQQFAISLSGEPTLYPKLAELIKELRRKGKTSFLVSNGLFPEKFRELQRKNALPTQLYVSLNFSDEKLFRKITKNKSKNAWEKFNQTLEIFPKLKTRKVLRMTLVKGENSNMKKEMIKEYIELIKKSQCDFLEIKGYMAVGFARNRKGMGYGAMPNYEEIKEFAKKLAKSLGKPYKILDRHEFSRIILLGKDKDRMKIKKEEI